MGFAHNEDHVGQYGGSRVAQNNSYLLTAPSNTEDSASPYSPSAASYTDNSYNSLPRNMGTSSILKNGSLRSRSRAYDLGSVTGNGSGNSTVLRPMKYHHNNSYDNGYSMDTMDYNGGNYNSNYANTAENHYGNTDNNHFVYEHNSYNNGNAMGPGVDQPLLGAEEPPQPLTQQLNSCLKKKPNNSMNNSVNNHKDIMKDKVTDDVYPAVAKHSPSLQIIATRNRPCCECLRNNQRIPLCLLFLVFIVVSCSLITGVMFYLKSGKNVEKVNII